MRNPIFYLSIILLFSCKNGTQESITSKPLEVSDNELINYVEYCNDRFDVCFDYPSNFGAQPEPVNGDGRTFLNEIDSAEIVLYGFLDQGNEGLHTQLDILNEMMEIDDLIESTNGIDVRGIERESGKIHHEKLRIKPDISAGTYDDGSPVNIIYSLQFVYPTSKQSKYNKYWDKMSEKFK